MEETVTISFHALPDDLYEIWVRDSWSDQTTKGTFIPPYVGKQITTLQKKLERGRSSDQELQKVGYRLFTALCGLDAPASLNEAATAQPVQAVLQEIIRRTLRRRGTVALTLIFGPGCDEFIRYPWELLHNEDYFLVLSGIFTVSRSLLRPDAPVGCQLPVQPPFRILYIGSSPQDCPPLETERSFQAMEQGLATLMDAGQISLNRLEPPTYSHLVRYFNLYGGVGLLDDSDTTMPCYIVHFDGHGAYGRLCPNDECKTMNEPDARRCKECRASLAKVTPQTYLCFCDDENRNDFVDAQSLRRLLVSSDIRLAVFSACETAMVTSVKGQEQRQRAAVDASLATALVTGQVPAVVAMPFSLLDDMSPIFVNHFYESLANGRTLEEALSRARQAMFSTHQRSWFIPVLYRLVAQGEEGPVALLSRPGSNDEHEHPLARLGPPATFVGRERELQELDALLATAVNGRQRADVPGHLQLRAGCRRIALTGPAGMGKSALAYEAVRRNRGKFAGEIMGISLRGGKTFSEALIEMSRYLRVPIPVRTTGAADVKQRLRLVLTAFRSLVNRELGSLLFLDSFEEVRDHAEIEMWLQFLCSLPQELTVIVTSRSNPEHMAVVEGAHCRWYEYPVGKMTDADLLKLFKELAAASGLDQRIRLEHSRQQKILSEICTLLDGYPLGAELIFGTAQTIDGQIYAPEATTRPLEEVRNELRKTPLAGIQAALDVSYRHLSPAARLLLSYLAAFKLPFSHEQISMLVTPAAVATASQELATAQELDQLVKGVIDAEDVPSPRTLERQWSAARAELVRASFMQFVDGHLYAIHSQVRQFALARLPLEEQRRIHRLVASYYATLDQPGAAEWFEAFEHLEAAGEAHDLQEAIRVAIRAAYALEGSRSVREVQTILRRASGYAHQLEDKTGEAEIQCRLGALLRVMGQYTEAEVCLESSLAAHRQLHEEELAGKALYELTLLYCESGDFPQAYRHAQETMALFSGADSSRGEAYAYAALGQIDHGCARYDDAQQHFARALGRFIQQRDVAGRALVLNCQGRTRTALGEYEDALRKYEEAERLLRDIERSVDLLWVHVYKSMVYAQQGKLDRAERTGNDVLLQFQELGIQRGEAWTLRILGDINLKQSDYVRARSYYERASALFSSVGDRIGQATVLNALGQVSLAEHEALNARGYFEQARTIAEKYEARRIDAQALRGLGDGASALHQWLEAEQAYQKALTIFTEIGIRGERAILLYRLGIVYEAEQKYHQALEAWSQSLSLDLNLQEPARSELREKVERLKQHGYKTVS